METSLRLLIFVLGSLILGAAVGLVRTQGPSSDLASVASPGAIVLEGVPTSMLGSDGPLARLALGDVFDLSKDCARSPTPDPLCGGTPGGSLALVPGDHDDEIEPSDAVWPEPEWRVLTRERLGGGRRGIRVLWADGAFQIGRGGETLGLPAHKSEVRRALPVLREAVALYPTGLLERIGIRRFVFVDELHREGRPLAGLARASTGTILVDPVRQARHAEMTVHHEIMHFLDRASASRPDRTWTSLNPPGTRYGTLDSTRLGALELSVRHRGFLTLYSQKNPAEDKAELFKWLVAYPDIVDRFVERDTFLASKIQHLATRLNALDSRLDDAWWRAVWAEEGRRSEEHRRK